MKQDIFRWKILSKVGATLTKCFELHIDFIALPEICAFEMQTQELVSWDS